MDKSIETIWQRGFVSDIASTTPKVNDLYNKKSHNLIDRFERMFILNQRAVIAMSLMTFIGLFAFGAPVLAGVIAIMLLGLVVVGRKQLVEMRKIDREGNCYQYLVAFNEWLQAAIDQYVNIYRYFYPILFAFCGIRLCYSDLFTSFFSDIGLKGEALGIPTVALIIIGVLSLVIGFFGGTIYRADVKLAYGRELDKLEELIVDMEELRK